MRCLIVTVAIAFATTAHAQNIGIPLNDLGPLPYRLGFIGGLYENGSNAIPADHLAAGMIIAHGIQPLDVSGQPSSSGKIAILTIGDGDTNRVVCAPNGFIGCEDGSFTALVSGNRRVNPAVVIVNGTNARLHTLDISQIEAGLDDIQRNELTPLGLSEQQVQVAWLQLSMEHPTVDITCACADDYNLKFYIALTLRRIRARYPNLKIAFLSDRPYAGYDPNPWNAEPFAYDTAIANRIIIQVQLDESRSGFVSVDSRVGPIDYVKDQAPWLAWGPYMWANGMTPRSDGLTWQPEDYDGPLVSAKGANKEATMLFDFFMTHPITRGWFAVAAPPRARAVRH